MMIETSATIALLLAQDMLTTGTPNSGMYFGLQGPYGAIAILNSGFVECWVDNMPENVDYPNQPAWDASSTPNNPTTLPFPPAVGCSLAWMSLYCAKFGGNLDIIAKLVIDDPYLVLTTAPHSPTWDELIQAMKDAGWPSSSNDPFNAWLPANG